MKKTFISSALMLVAGFAQAQTTSQMEVSANVQSGCFAFANNYHFDLPEITKVTKNLELQCSKGTTVRVELYSQTNPGALASYYLTKNGILQSQSQAGEYINYAPYVTGVVSTPNEYTVLEYPINNILSIIKYGHSLSLRILSSEKVSLPVEIIITNTDFKLIKAGDYEDTLTYTLTY